MKRSVMGGAVGTLVLFLTIACRHQAVTSSVPISTSESTQKMEVDQVNTEGWDNAWTNLLNKSEQSFTPSLPRLLAVEVELIVGNPGPPKDELTLTIRDAEDEELISVTRTVRVDDADRMTFLMPEGGLPVTPGRVYAIQLSGGATFGWKYVVGGYDRGDATLNGKPLLADGRSTFLFRTFGSR